jgi:hypothetical protein
MKYTKDDLAKMSIAEINEVLQKILGRWVDGDGRITWMLGDDVITQTEGGYAGKVNYCANWNDLMPLAVEHKIHFGPDGDLDNPINHYAISDKSISSENLIELVDSNPQRAIACCLILVLQEQQQ